MKIYEYSLCVLKTENATFIDRVFIDRNDCKSKCILEMYFGCVYFLNDVHPAFYFFFKEINGRFFIYTDKKSSYLIHFIKFFSSILVENHFVASQLHYLTLLRNCFCLLNWLRLISDCRESCLLLVKRSQRKIMTLHQMTTSSRFLIACVKSWRVKRRWNRAPKRGKKVLPVLHNFF